MTADHSAGRPHPGGDAGITDRQTALLRAEGLRKTYRGASEAALRGVDVAVGPGEIFGLLGPNGAGKTTAISIMSGLLKPDAGTVRICGTDLLRQPREAKKRFALVPQDVALYPELTARENLAYFGRLCGVEGRVLQERIAAALTLAGLESRGDERVSAYSGGMRRRANLAAGLLNDPRILFLDEPTVGIDAHSRDLILERLAGLARQGIGMIYTTHYMEEAARICTRVGIIDAGRIILEGVPSDLMVHHPGCADLGELFMHLTGRRLRD